MTRVSTFSQGQTLVAQMMRNQAFLRTEQIRVATGKVGTDLREIARDANVLLSTRTVSARTDSFLKANRELAVRLELQNSALSGIAKITDEFRNDLIKTVNLNSGIGLINKMTDHMDRLINLLNTTLNGKFLFSGTRSDKSPINVSTTADLLALPNAAAAFDNNAVKLTQRLDENRVIEYGILANDAAEPLLNAIRRIQQFANGTIPSGAGAYTPAGAFTDPLSENQANFLINEFSVALTAISAARNAEELNGIHMNTIKKQMERQQEEINFLEIFTAEIENVDIAEAITNLKAGETALQASLQVIARLGRLTLLDYI
jgi:flagellar hook-associated protein 3 FlgL